MTDLEMLAQNAQDKKQLMKIAKKTGSMPIMLAAAQAYADSIYEWHIVKYPAKRFRKPTPESLLRMKY